MVISVRWSIKDIKMKTPLQLRQRGQLFRGHHLVLREKQYFVVVTFNLSKMRWGNLALPVRLSADSCVSEAAQHSDPTEVFLGCTPRPWLFPRWSRLPLPMKGSTSRKRTSADKRTRRPVCTACRQLPRTSKSESKHWQQLSPVLELFSHWWDSPHWRGSRFYWLTQGDFYFCMGEHEKTKAVLIYESIWMHFELVSLILQSNTFYKMSLRGNRHTCTFKASGC